jgi:hypothetical protein
VKLLAVSFFIARGKYGVVEKELIEIAEAAHQESSRNLLPDAVVVPHQGADAVSAFMRETSIVHFR